MLQYAPTKVTWAIGDATARILALHQGTDRHQVAFSFAAAELAPFTVHVASPPLTQGAVPPPASVDALDWVPVAWTPSDDDIQVISCVGRYLRLTPLAGGPVAAVQATYQPAPPTSA